MTISIRALAFGSLLSIGLSSLAAAEAPEPVTLRFLASQGSLSPHELAYELGYFDSLGIRLENVGYAGGGPASLFRALPPAASTSARPATAAVSTRSPAETISSRPFRPTAITSRSRAYSIVLEDSRSGPRGYRR